MWVGSSIDVYSDGDAWIWWKSSDEWEIWNRSDAPAFDFCFKTHGIGEWEKEPKEKWIFMLYDDADFKHAYGLYTIFGLKLILEKE